MLFMGGEKEDDSILQIESPSYSSKVNFIPTAKPFP